MRKPLTLLLALGWIPTPGVVAGARWSVSLFIPRAEGAAVPR